MKFAALACVLPCLLFAVATGQATCGTLGQYPHGVAMTSGPAGTVQVDYRVEADRLVARTTFSSNWQGWAAIGFSQDSGSMYLANAFIADVPSGKVSEYYITGLGFGDVNSIADQSKLLSANVTVENGLSVMYFTRLLPPSGTDGYITVNSAANLIWAAGNGPLGYHGRTYGSATAMLGACGVTKVQPATPPPPPPSPLLSTSAPVVPTLSSPVPALPPPPPPSPSPSLPPAVVAVPTTTSTATSAPSPVPSSPPPPTPAPASAVLTSATQQSTPTQVVSNFVKPAVEGPMVCGTNGDFPNSATMSGRAGTVQVYYRLESDRLVTKTVFSKTWGGCLRYIQYLTQACRVAIGLSQYPGSMYLANAFIADVPSGKVSEYYITGLGFGDVNPTADQSKVVDGRVAIENGMSVLYFTRLLDPAKGDGFISLQGVSNLIWAAGEGSLGGHGRTYGSASVTLGACGIYSKAGAVGGTNVISVPSVRSISTPIAPTSTVSSVSSASPTSTAGPASVGCGEQLGLSYGTQQRLDFNLLGSWVVEGNVLKAQFVLTQATGWFSIGFTGRRGKMSPATAIVGDTADKSVLEYFMSSTRASDVDLKGQQNMLTASNVSVSGGNTTLYFTRTITPGDDSYFQLNGSTYVIWAWGQGRLNDHGPRFGSATVDFNSCPNTKTESNNVNAGEGVGEMFTSVGSMKRHALLMFLAWGVASPLAIVTVRLMKACAPTYWLRLHLLLQATAVALGLAGFVVAWRKVDGFTAGTHQIMGVSMLAMVFAQALFAVKRPYPMDFNNRVSSARKIWAIAHQNVGCLSVILAHVTMYFGLKQTTASNTLYHFFYAWCGAVCAVYIAAIALGACLPKRQPQNPYRDGGAPTARSGHQPLKGNEGSHSNHTTAQC